MSESMQRTREDNYLECVLSRKQLVSPVELVHSAIDFDMDSIPDEKAGRIRHVEPPLRELASGLGGELRSEEDAYVLAYARRLAQEAVDTEELDILDKRLRDSFRHFQGSIAACVEADRYELARHARGDDADEGAHAPYNPAQKVLGHILRQAFTPPELEEMLELGAGEYVTRLRNAVRRVAREYGMGRNTPPGASL